MEKQERPIQNIQIEVPKWLSDYDQAIQAASSLVRTVRAYSWILSEPKHKELFPYFNNSLFAAMNNLDLMINLKYLDGSMRICNFMEGNYFARIAALHLHEIFNDLHKLIDKKLRDKIINHLGEEGVKAMDGLIKELNEIKKDHIKMLKKVRNNVIGHKMADAVKQSDMINEVEIRRIFDLGHKTFGLQIKVTGFYTSVIEKVPKKT